MKRRRIDKEMAVGGEEEQGQERRRKGSERDRSRKKGNELKD